MPALSSQDYTNIIIAVLGVVAFAYKQFVEPRQPAQKAAKINAEITTLTQVTTLIVQKVEQLAGNLSPTQRKAAAIRDIKALLSEIGAPIPSDEAISGAIESAVYLIGLTQAKAPQTISTEAVRPPER